MKYAIIAVLLLTAYYEATFAAAQWKSKNRLGAVGIIVLTLLSIAAPVGIMFFR